MFPGPPENPGQPRRETRTAMTTVYRVTDPATGEVAEEFATATDSEILAALDRSATAFTEWSRTPVAERDRKSGAEGESVAEGPGGRTGDRAAESTQRGRGS